MRARYVKINLDILPKSLPFVGEGLENPVIRLNLFSNTNYDVQFDKIEKSKATPTTIWTGHIPGKELSRVTIAVTNGVAAGNIRTGDGEWYKISYDSNGIHIIKQINESLIPPEIPPKPVDLPYSPMPPKAGADSGATITVMVVYTTSAKEAAGGQSAIKSIINSAISTMNTTFSNSGITPRVSLSHTAEVSYSRGENGSSSGFTTALYDLTGTSDGYMDDVHTLRDTYNADMVQLLFNNEGSGGLAWLMDRLSSSFAAYAFSVVHYDYADGWALDHEFGHNMGMTHDRTTDAGGGGGLYSYSYGYISPTSSWHTVMAYYSACSGGYCPRIDYWANPDISYNGEATGIAVGETNEADARTTLNNTAYTVANWRTGDTDTAGTPVPTLTANGSSSDISISSGSSLVIKISLDTASNTSAADWWLLASTPFGFYYYNLSLGWTPGSSVTYQANLTDLASTTMLSTSTLPSGIYTFYFGVDTNQDGDVTASSLQYKSVTVIIS